MNRLWIDTKCPIGYLSVLKTVAFHNDFPFIVGYNATFLFWIGGNLIINEPGLASMCLHMIELELDGR